MQFTKRTVVPGNRWVLLDISSAPKNLNDHKLLTTLLGMPGEQLFPHGNLCKDHQQYNRQHCDLPSPSLHFWEREKISCLPPSSLHGQLCYTFLGVKLTDEPDFSPTSDGFPHSFGFPARLKHDSSRVI